MLHVLQVHSQRGVACETNALHVWIQFHSALRSLPVVVGKVYEHHIGKTLHSAANL